MHVLITHRRWSFSVRLLSATFVILLATLAVGSYGVFRLYTNTTQVSIQTDTTATPTPFPVSVFPAEKKIISNDSVNLFLTEHLATMVPTANHMPWTEKVIRTFSQSGFFQQLASSQSRVLVIWAGERKEEVAARATRLFSWSNSDKEDFLALLETQATLPEGVLLPGNYVFAATATPTEVFETIQQRFTDEILSRYPTSVAAIVPLKDAITIASLLEREAYSFEHMRLIAGVIWNRLFINMPLQIDASLQYVKGNEPQEPWWPVPNSQDKYIESPYNTYKNTGLPPTAISNPSMAAIVAALNPTQTDCLFYFHERNGTMHCSNTYEEHVAALRAVYGRGE